jgi:hypothetical protein
MHVRATYTIRALYWEQVSIGADHVLISELIREEENRQAHALRLYVAIHLIPKTPSNESSFSSLVAQQESCPQHFVNAA